MVNQDQISLPLGAASPQLAIAQLMHDIVSSRRMTVCELEEFRSAQRDTTDQLQVISETMHPANSLFCHMANAPARMHNAPIALSTYCERMAERHDAIKPAAKDLLEQVWHVVPQLDHLAGQLGRLALLLCCLPREEQLLRSARRRDRQHCPLIRFVPLSHRSARSVRSFL